MCGLRGTDDEKGLNSWWKEIWGKVIHTYMSKRKLTKEMVDAFVDSIIIYGKYDYEIKLVYDDQFAELQKIMKEKEAQSR